MKKTYLNPTLTVVNVQPAQVIASSPDAKFSKSGSTTTMDGRQGSFSGWTEEEE